MDLNTIRIWVFAAGVNSKKRDSAVFLSETGGSVGVATAASALFLHFTQ